MRDRREKGENGKDEKEVRMIEESLVDLAHTSPLYVRTLYVPGYQLLAVFVKGAQIRLSQFCYFRVQSRVEHYSHLQVSKHGLHLGLHCGYSARLRWYRPLRGRNRHST